MGPGTKVITNLDKGVKPIDYIDQLAMYHDIEYIRNNYDISDLQAITKSYNKISLPAIAMRTGLVARMISRIEPKQVYKTEDINYLYNWAQQKANDLKIYD